MEEEEEEEEVEMVVEMRVFALQNGTIHQEELQAY